MLEQKVLPGLSRERQEYLYKEVRQFVDPMYQVVICPKPTAPELPPPPKQTLPPPPKQTASTQKKGTATKRSTKKTTTKKESI